MKKTVWIALGSFLIGLILAGIFFIYIPEKQADNKPFLEKNISSSYSSPLYASQISETNKDFVEIIKKIGPSVVKIQATKVERVSFGAIDSPFDDFWDRFFGIPQERHSIVVGSGFFISPDGYLLTNNHIAENSERIKVYSFQGKNYDAEIVGLDKKSDLALLKVEDNNNLPYAQFGNSEELQIGEWVLAFGNPMGMTHTVTSGIVSAKGRHLSTDYYQNFIQTDAAINRGNSGGPLVDMNGNVIGINTMILAPTGGNIGIGFAIPSNLAVNVIEQLKKSGKVIRGYLGVTIKPIDEDVRKVLGLKSNKGALINSIEAGSPADKAGLKTYDVIIEVEGEPIKDDNDLKFKIAELPPGKRINIKIIRDGKEKIVSTKLGKQDSDDEATIESSSEEGLGFRVQELTESIAHRYNLTTTEGLIIIEIKRGSPADLKGLQVGDIILEINRKRVKTVDDVKSILKNVDSGDPILLLIRRERRGLSEDYLVTLRIS